VDDVKTTETPEQAELPEAAEPEPPNESKQFTKLGEDIGAAAPSQPANSLEPVTQAPMAGEPSKAGQRSKLAIPGDFSERTWLIAATVFVALATLLIFSLTSRRNRVVQEKSAERIVESLTPEAVITGCGQPLEDVTKDLYPMIMRTMSYKPSGAGSVVLAFSRTSEENSQWIFLSMKNGSGTIKYETPDMQMAALPCLGSRK
jgi:hypothetical protein